MPRAGARSWVLTDPEGAAHTFEGLTDLRAALDRGDLGPLPPREGSEESHESEAAIHLTTDDVELRGPSDPGPPPLPLVPAEDDETPLLPRVASTPPSQPKRATASVARAPAPETQRSSPWLLHVGLACGALGAVAFVVHGRSPSPPKLPADDTKVQIVASDPAPRVTVQSASTAVAPSPASTASASPVYVAATVAVVSTKVSAPEAARDEDAGPAVAASRAQAFDALRAHDYVRAETLFEQVVARSPHDAEALVALGDAARARGNRPDAEAAYRRAVSAAPTLMPAELGLADVLWDAGEKDAARDRYRDVVARFPAAPDRARERAGSVSR